MNQASTSAVKNNKDLSAYKAELNTLFALFEAEVTAYVEKAWQEEQDLKHLNVLEESAFQISARIIDIGDLCTSALENDKEDIAFYKICYQWVEDSKAYLILWRNIIFEEQKALLLVSDGKTNRGKFLFLKAESKTVLENATQGLLKSLKNAIQGKDSNAKRLIDKLTLQDNPWPVVYKQQIATIAPQCEALVHQFEILWNASGIYVLVKSEFHDDFDEYKISIEQFKVSINEIASSLEFVEEIDISEVVKNLQLLNEQHLSDRSFQDLQKGLESNIKGLPKDEQYVIQLSQNILSYENIHLKERTRIWLDSEVLPLINNFYAIRENIKNQFNLSLSNIKNRLSAERDEGIEFDKKELLTALTTFVKRLEKSEHQIVGLRNEVSKQLSTLYLYKIYDGNFLNLSIASTLNKYNRSSRKRFEGIKKWISEKGIFVRQFQDSVEQEERLSIAEKLVRVINARKPTEGSAHYTNMFMTKGYIGSSFMVGRQAELLHIKSIIENWQLGFRGAVMITGTRFSGKTLLSEVISQRHFQDKTIKLVAGKKLQVGGRHLDPTYSLSDQLDFIVKYSLQGKVLVFIDDLHQWDTEDYPLLQNVRAMTKAIDRHSNKIFFMVCLNNWLKERLQSALNLDSIFQAEINTDSISFEEMNKAILIRHSATHTDLVNTEGEELKINAVHKIIKHIFYETHGNIGESLMRWAHDINMYDDDKVKYTFTDHVVPQFLNPSLSILLMTIITYGATNEYHLRRLFGPAFQDEYKPILQRLINVGVVERNLNGKLEIRQCIVNDIAALLEENASFTYLKKSNTQ